MRYVDPALYDTGIDSGEDAEPPGCTFDDQGDAAVRFVNAAPGFEQVDLCVRPQGETQWRGTPITRGLGRDCPDGVGYKQVTAPRALPPGTFDLKVIASSDADCDAAGLAEASSVGLGEGVTTVAHASKGGDGVLVALPESPAQASSTLVRFVHLMDGVEKLDAFIANTTVWPPEPRYLAVSSLEFGALPSDESSSEIGDITSRGYVGTFFAASDQTFGVLASSGEAPQPNDDGSAPWLSVVRRGWKGQVAYGVFAVGRVGDLEFPPELMACLESEDDGIWTACRDAAAYDLSVSVLHTTLSGADYPHYKVRADQMGTVVAGADTDVMCLAFVMSDDHKRAIEDASREAGFNVAWAKTDLNTPVDDPRRYDGTVPEPPSGPPCEGEESLQVVEAVLNCAAAHCTGGAGPSAGIEDTGCLAEHCILPLLDVVTKPAPQQRCGMSLLFTMLDGTPLEQVEQLCATNNAAGMAFGGSSGVMLLSKLPIRDIEYRVLPSWVWRASVTKATVDLPNEQAVDVYCTQLSTSERPSSFPYVGVYGDGPLGDKRPWTNEALLQAQRVLEFVRQRSGPRPAIVAGGLESGKDCPACQPPLDSFGPEVLTSLISNLNMGTAPDYAWQCLECGDNPLRALEGRSAVVNLWTDHILLHRFASTDVVATSRIFEAPTISFPVEGGFVEVPPSSHYGLRTTVRPW